MHPILLEIGPFTFYSYGFLISVGVLCGFWLARTLAHQTNIDWKKLKWAGIFAVCAAFVGSKSLFFLTAGDPGNSQSIASGNVFYGVPLFAIPTFWFFARRGNLNSAASADIGMLAISLAQSIGRLGCLMAGCCYGKPTNLPFAIKLYAPTIPENLRGVPLHPVQLYSSLLEFALFLVLYKQFRLNHKPGEIVLSYFVGYGVIRFLEEGVRGDDFERGIWYGFSTSQILSLATASIALPLLLRLRARPAHAES